MVGKRERVARLLDGAGVTRALVSLQRMARPLWLPVLTYHRVGRPYHDDPLPPESYDAWTEQFDDQLGYLADNFTFITSADVVAFLDGAALPPNPVMVTFDDGYAECRKVALPILRAHGAKATFFIATDYIERRRLFWWDRLRLLVTRSDREVIELTYPHRVDVPLQHAGCILTTLVKTMRGLDLERFLDHVAERAGVVISASEEAQLVTQLVMSWEDIAALLREGMDVQSHTRTHRVVQTLLPDELCEELCESRALIERRLGIRVTTLAYPVGYPIRGNAVIRQALGDAGYRAAFSNQTGPIAAWRANDAFDLSRISMSTTYSAEYFRSLMALPLLARRNRAMPSK